MEKACAKCGHVNAQASGSDLDECPNCGAVYLKVEQLAKRGAFIRAVAVPTTEERERAARQARALAAQAAEEEAGALQAARRTGDWSAVLEKVIQREARAVVVTTTAFVPGHEITEIRGVVSSDYAYAFSAVREAVGGLARNIVGSGPSVETVRLLGEARQHVLAALPGKALVLGANAVIDVRFDHEEFSGANGHGVLVVVATGTAVRLAPAARNSGGSSAGRE